LAAIWKCHNAGNLKMWFFAALSSSEKPFTKFSSPEYLLGFLPIILSYTS
jgi:hypothetical protein